MEQQYGQAPSYPQSPPSQPSLPKSGGGKKAGWLTLLILLLAGAAVYGVYAWQQQKIDDVNKVVTKLSAENDDLRYQLKALNSSTIVGAVEGGSTEQKLAKSHLVDFYKKWSVPISSQADGVNRLASVTDYITLQAKAQHDKEFTYNLFTCSQMREQLIVIENPSISGAKASVEVVAIDSLGISGIPPYVRAPLTLSLVKQNSKWLIDSVSCPV